MPAPQGTTELELSRLGVGGAGDSLRFRLVLKVLWRCVPLLHPVRFHLLWLLLLALGLAAVALPFVLLLADLFWTRVLTGEAPTAIQCRLLPVLGASCDSWDEPARQTALRGLVGATVATSMVAGLWAGGLYYYRIWILQRVNQVLRLRMHDRLHALSLRFHNESPVGDGLYRIYQDSGMVTQLIDMLVLMPMLHFGVTAAMLLLVSAYAPKLVIALVIGWCIALVIGYRFSRPMRVAFRSAREHNSALTSMIAASMQGVRLIKAYGAERVQQERFEQLSEAAFAKAYAARSRFVTYTMTTFWAFGAMAVLAIAWGALLSAQAAPLSAKALGMLGFSVWGLGLWENFRGRFGNSVSSSFLLFDLWGRMQDTAIGLDRVFELLDLEPEVKEAKDAADLALLRNAVEIDRVSFAYEAGKQTLHEVSLRAEVGTITAIVGPTGSGKSTLMSLLLRLYDPDQGAIRIDDVDIRNVKLDSLRANVAIALQENLLFGTTIRENIRYAAPDASDEQVRGAARVACAAGFIEQLPASYDTLLGERGSKLSTGQRQRLSIARALLKDSPILILDEPTAALDAQTEHDVLENLTAWGKGRVVFLITHRLSTIRRAHQVVFLQEGRVIEIGTHEQLMATPGSSYRRLCETEAAAARIGAEQSP